ncbi:MAG: replication initiation protein, partial [Ruminococcus sp.]|nr:replication initiation protein [Ruminococcus sp.]
MKKKSEKFRKISETLENLCYKMPFPERRFFTVYLARFDTDNNAKGIVEFSVIEFRKIMEIDPYSDDMDSLRQATDSILNKITEIPEHDGNSKIVPLLCDCRILRNNNQIFLSFTPHRDIMPFLTDFKEKLFSNHIWNCFALESESQILMYKLLRYYFDLGIVEIN